MARKSLLLAIVTVIIIVVIAGGYLGWTLLNTNQNSPTPSPSITATPLPSETPAASQTPEVSPSPTPSPEQPNPQMEQLRDRTMVYIEANISQTTALMQNLSWMGGRQETGILGATTYLYNSGNWSVKIEYPVIPDPTYTIAANYSSENSNVEWTGTYQNRTFTETSRVVSVDDSLTLPVQEHVREALMSYIKFQHKETAQYMQGLIWVGGRITPEGILGAETYSYQSLGWNMTMQYPVVPNPTYTVTAEYTSPVSQVWPQQLIVEWHGTFQNGTILENSYAFTP